MNTGLPDVFRVNMAASLATILLLLHIHVVSNAWTDSDYVPRRCSSAPTPANTNRKGCSSPYTYRESCSYYCRPGYTQVSGSTTRTCSADGSWTGTNLICRLTGCSSAPTPANSSMSGCSSPYTHGERCTYSCLPGYIRVYGSTTMTCYNGSWAGTNLVCTREPSWSASTEFNSAHSADLADIDTVETSDAAGAWAAATNDMNQWLMRDLGVVKVVTGITTKGRNYSPDWPWGGHEQYVTSYVISYGDENGDEKFYTNAVGQDIVFLGNCDRDTEVNHQLRSYYGPITARFIKIHPQTWHGHISMRAKIITAPKKWREDLHCGQGYPAEDGNPAECDPEGSSPCCSQYNWCGSTAAHCDCSSCVDYRNTGHDMEQSTTTIIMPGATCSFGTTTEQLTSTLSTKPEATSNMDNVVTSASSVAVIFSLATENPQVSSTPRPVLPTKAETTLDISVDTTAATSDAVPANSPTTESPVIASRNVSLTLTAPSSVNLSLLRDSIKQTLETHICGDQCEIGEIFLHIVNDTNRTARKKRQAGDEVQINVTVQLIVLASQEGTLDGKMAESLLLEKAAMLKELALSGDLSVNIHGKLVRRVNNSDAKKKTPPWLIGVICAAVVVIIIIVLVTVLLCRRKHNPGANMPTKSGNEMTNLDTPKRRDHPATDGSVDNIIYNTEDEGFVDNVIYNAGDDGTVDNVIYEGQDSQKDDREIAPESQYETVN